MVIVGGSGDLYMLISGIVGDLYGNSRGYHPLLFAKKTMYIRGTSSFP